MAGESAPSRTPEGPAPTERGTLEFDWEVLLWDISIDEVIPIVGKELLQVEIDGEEMLFERYLVTRLAEELGVDPRRLSEYDLNELAGLHLSEPKKDRRIEKRRIYAKIQQILTERSYPIPEPLRKLARITDFKLFISTTFDSFLRRAIEEQRGQERTECRAYHIRDYHDLPAGFESGADSIVYQIFGCLKSKTGYSVTDEDSLEFLHELQDPELRPERLFEQLAGKNLLFIGCGFPDGLARFLVRTLANERLEEARFVYKIADREAARNAQFALFLRHCRKVEVFHSGDAIEFVNQLYDQWQARQEKEGAEPEVDRPPPPRQPVNRPEKGSLFLSYARSDQEAVLKLKRSLEDAGLKMWLDQREIQGGADWRAEIRKNIGDCVLFLPCVSKNAQVRAAEGVLFEEWGMALNRRKTINQEIPFIVPILLDDIAEGATLIPPEFWTPQCIRCPKGEIDRDRVRQIQKTMMEAQSLRSGRFVQV